VSKPDFDRTTRATRDDDAVVPPSSLHAVVEEGPDRGARWPLDGAGVERLLLGTSPICNLRLRDPHVSRRHAAFDVRQGLLHVVDLESTNGTVVDGVAITGSFLRRGQLLRVGDTSIRIQLGDTPHHTELATATSFGRVLGASPAMRRIYPLCERLAQTTVPVILEGETGTGKEVLAEALHEKGPRAAGPYVVFDCTAVPPSLVESEIFGHEKGAFTGALGTRKGVFEQADGGTLLIDEIGDLDLSLQPKLLRALERAEIRRVGGNQVIRVDVRVLAATRRDLDREIEAGRFRDDLFHRLAVARIELPALRDRAGDVRLLAQAFWDGLKGKADGLPEEVVARWEKATWPGNVRELRNAVLRYMALGSLEDTVSKKPSASLPQEDAGPVIKSWATGALLRDEPLPVARRQLVEEFERHYIEGLLARHGGDTAKAAAAAGVARRYLQVLLARQRR
jgi:two-component system, NtrC family, response regulator HydG